MSTWDDKKIKILKENPKTSPLSFPKANERTDKNNKLETNGDNKV